MDISDLQDKTIAVVMGGDSRESDISIRSGKKVMESRKRQGFRALEVYLNRNLPAELKDKNVDIAFLALHGGIGEGGAVQGLMEVMQLPYTGSGVLSSSLAINKVACKKIWQSENIPTPLFLEIDIEEDLQVQAEKVFKKLSFPVIVKPTCEGSSIGVEVVREKEELTVVLRKIITEFRNVFVEEFVEGKEVTVGILGNGNNLQALPVLQLRPKTGM